MRATDSRLVVGSLRELSTVAVVVGLGTAYAVTLLGVSDILTRVGEAEGEQLGSALDIVAGVFIAIALFVSAIVITSGIDTVIAGRRRQLTLLRLVGASARQLRVAVARAVGTVAVIGAVAGMILGAALTALGRTLLVRGGRIPDLPYATVPLGAPAAAIAMVAAAVIATLIGTRTVLGSLAVGPTVGFERPGRGRAVAAVLVAAASVAVLVAACVRGEQGQSDGFVLAFLGSMLLAIAVLTGARYVVPTAVRLVGVVLGRGPAGLVARRNAVADPARTTRSTIGLLIGVTLVTTIAAGMYSLQGAISGADGLDAQQSGESARILSIVTAVLLAMVAISAVIAAVGFVSTMSLTVITRTREIGMLRAMGFTSAQVRSMITRESIALSAAAVGAGLMLGITLGAVGTQSLVGSNVEGVTIGLPPATLAVIVVATTVLVLVASVPPARRAVRVSPVDALATV
ncbi:ABC transporter permease [Millisia brevis]|uniref:ABC transporter permease n=1 Tax=Millisia brevis TaxID=264148 RepID=UPI000835EE9B|nr:FtsX-like permease family protein [Millisia brevis]